jgi:hypothetical protein
VWVVGAEDPLVALYGVLAKAAGLLDITKPAEEEGQDGR